LLRFALSTGTAPGNDIKLASTKLEAGRNFANKLWNATRFVIRSIEPGAADMEIKQDSLPVEDRWMLSRLSQTISSATGLMEDFQFGEAQRQVHDFLWGEYCDWYIEFAKTRLRSGSESASPIPILVHVLETSLRLLHPYMPFITEELWQNLRRHLPASWRATESIMVAPYPEADRSAIDHQAEQIMETIVEIVRAIRNARAQYDVESSKWIEVQIYAGKLTPSITPHSEAIQTLARAKPITFLNKRRKGPPDDKSIVLVLKKAEVVIPMENVVNLEAERKRLEKEIGQTQAEINRLETRLNDEAFLAKAPAAIVEKERQKLHNTTDKLARLKQKVL